MDPSEILGGLVILVAIVLGWRERRVWVTHTPEDGWLVTRQRYVRRMAISVVMIGLGGLLVFVGSGIMQLAPTKDGEIRVGNLVTFTLGGAICSIILLILALLDFRDTARSAHRLMHNVALEIEPAKDAPAANEPKDV